jgi:dTDP-4-dehydrorhamnose reductase
LDWGEKDRRKPMKIYGPESLRGSEEGLDRMRRTIVMRTKFVLFMMLSKANFALDFWLSVSSTQFFFSFN